jgi:molecular chaperone GrpE (heat shock protein)
MIDFEKEIKKYNILKLSKNSGLELNNDYIFNINKDLHRIGKEQNNLSIQIDDIHESIENLNELNDLKKEFTVNKKQYENEKSKIINNILEILDEIENFKHYSNKNLDSKLNEQINIMWNRLESTINKIGLIRIDNKSEIFSNDINIAKKILTDNSKNNNEIIETLNSGYIFENQIIKKSNVVVNKKGLEING